MSVISTRMMVPVLGLALLSAAVLSQGGPSTRHPRPVEPDVCAIAVPPLQVVPEAEDPDACTSFAPGTDVDAHGSAASDPCVPGNEEPQEALLRLAEQDPDPDVRIAALKALATATRADVASRIDALASCEFDPRVRQTASETYFAITKTIGLLPGCFDDAPE